MSIELSEQEQLRRQSLAGSSVNLEIDLIARYMERMLAWRDENPGTEGNPA